MRILFSLFVIGIMAITSPVSAQPQKGSLTINPQILFSKLTFRATPEASTVHIETGTSLHYYISKRFAAGIRLQSYHTRSSPKAPDVFKLRAFYIGVTPEIHYILLASRFSPFVRVRYGSFGYYHLFIDNPLVFQRQRRNGNWIIDYGQYSACTSLGLAYSLKDRFALTGQIDVFPFQKDFVSYAWLGLGCQFVL
ncbi:hypothetical protein ACFSUS_06080 [Spirosoma soli]|uniref:Outer membrane beta-barrel protein n=1 Tax=Spirosoma soli TaxID=1770529 RepID=A0ABW5M1N6_9BACT